MTLVVKTLCFQATKSQFYHSFTAGMLKHLSFLTDYEYYYDYPTEISPAEDFDLTLDDWLYELLDITGKLLPASFPPQMLKMRV